MRIALFCAAALALCACQTTYVAHTRDVRALALQNRFDEAAQLDSQFVYSPDDRVLELLNQGALLHDAGKYRESNARLLEAEDRLTSFQRRSVGGELARSAVSGASGAYLGEDYERILIHVYTAQNYLALGAPSDAAVEARRLSERLGVLEDVKGHGRHYRDDGFAQWLAGLLYEDANQPNDAALSFRDALANFPDGPQHAWLCGDLLRASREASLPVDDVRGCDGIDGAPLSSDGELVLLHAGGLAPERSESRVSCSLDASILHCDDDADHPDLTRLKLVSVAVPKLEPIVPRVVSATLEVDGQPTQTLVMEDVSAIALQTLADRMPEYRREATTRALARLAASTAAGAGAARLDDKKPALGALVGVLTDAALSETEEADRRSWFTLPAYFAAARVRLAPGAHGVQVVLRDAKGQAVRRIDLGKVTIGAGQRTFLELRSAD